MDFSDEFSIVRRTITVPSSGTGTKFVAYLSSSPTFLKYQMDIYWPIMKTKLTNNEHSLHSM